MEKHLINKLFIEFDRILHVLPDSNIEFWYARDLQITLGYDRWENFNKIIEKAMASCATLEINIADHFRQTIKKIIMGSMAERSVHDIILTRYACYLIAQNGDPRKEQIAFAQSYFAMQTRKQEIIEKRMELNERLYARRKLKESETELSKNIYERGVDDQGFGRIRSQGDAALFGGYNTQSMKTKLKVPDKRALADFLPTITITAKNFATEITNHNVNQHDLYGEVPITNEHVQNNLSVRNLLIDRGVKPENLPAAEDLKKLERKVKSEENKLLKNTKYSERMD